MIIIVEGIDRVGKTTLCNLISSEMKIPILKDRTVSGMEKTQSITREIATEKIFTTLNVLRALGPKTDIIIDRFHVSEWVYGQVNRGYINDFMPLHIDSELAKLNAVLILVEPDDIELSIKKHGSDLHKHDELFKKYMIYFSIMRRLRCTYSNLDVVLPDLKLLKDSGALYEKT